MAKLLRQCVFTREKKLLTELIRFSCKLGKIEIDNGNKKEGRGAYITKDPLIFEKALQQKKIEKSLKLKKGLSLLEVEDLKKSFMIEFKKGPIV